MKKFDKSIRYFYTKDIDCELKIAFLRDDEYHHAVNVNRLKLGDELCVINGEGFFAEAWISEVGKECVMCSFDAFEQHESKRRVTITLAQALSRNNIFSFVVEKATELGCANITPLVTERCVMKLKDIEKFKEKNTKIIRGTLKQCHRLFEPILHAPTTFKKLMLQTKDYDYRISFELFNGKAFSEFRKNIENKELNILVAIGPEGGFSDNEKTLFSEYGFSPITLPDAVLRSETAAITALSLLKFGL